MSDEERREATRMLEAATNRTGRLLVLLVEFDGLPIDRAAKALTLTTARAREQLASLRLVALIESRQRLRNIEINRLAGAKERRKIAPKSFWRKGATPPTSATSKEGETVQPAA